MANSNYSDALATTLAYRSKELADNVSKNNALLHHLKDKSKIREISGGSKILEELEYGEGDMIWYNGYDAIDYSPKQLFSAAEYALKLCAVPVAISGEDLLKNSGPEKIIDLFEKRVENLNEQRGCEAWLLSRLFREIERKTIDHVALSGLFYVY